MSILDLFRRRRPPSPSEEATRAAEHAKGLFERAEKVYGERRQILDENQFAARIRSLYEG